MCDVLRSEAVAVCLHKQCLIKTPRTGSNTRILQGRIQHSNGLQVKNSQLLRIYWKSGTNHDFRANTQQIVDFGDIIILHPYTAFGLGFTDRRRINCAVNPVTVANINPAFA
ncbi:hypothetical protein Pan153_03520 [Gimesia panareensis]|uniref:Uncharacterized protein n=1 Tax=Gimesia panareensis TaxID=2527978 RepID=A0A518FHB0_9PLAN|nr:hypothetical protein Pan153_03520 [Gimesia panareensis]